MEDCTIEIKTHTKGKVSFYRAKGSLERTERGAFVRYSHEDEEVLLVLAEDRLEMERESLSMRFQRGEATAVKLRMSGREGTIPLKTHYYAREEQGGGFMAVMRYELGEPSQKFIVNIRIGPGSEER